MTALRQLSSLSVRAEPAEHALDIILCALETKSGLRVAFANTHLLYHALTNRQLQEMLGSFLVLNDGVGLELAARIACGEGFPDNLNGTDFVPRLLASTPAGKRVYLYGARDEVAANAASALARFNPHLSICGFQHGYTQQLDEAAIIGEIARLEPDIVLVALGNPYQEAWIARAAPHIPQATLIGVGALFDFMAGSVTRAPKWIQFARLEWLFRLAREPRRLWRRYTIEIIVVAFALLCARLSTRRASAGARV
ncbi:MAG: WecB/TagA/CpsF family glycosyltransferase [Pseudomonadota bacterium]